MLLLLKLFWCLVSLFPHQLIFSRPYSRRLEAEADQVGLQLAAKVSLVHFGTGSLNCLRHKKASCKQIQLYRECKALSSRLWLLNSRGHCCQIKIRVSLCPVCACVRACPGMCGCASRPRFLAANGNQRPAEWRAQPSRVAVHTPVAQEQNHAAGPPHTSGIESLN